jgi:hypothetical protein
MSIALRVMVPAAKTIQFYFLNKKDFSSSIESTQSGFFNVMQPRTVFHYFEYLCLKLRKGWKEEYWKIEYL